MIDKLKSILLSIELFSLIVIQIPLYQYQIRPANAVIDSCLNQKGLEFLWIFPRQSGKDETIAQMCTYLLTLFQRIEAHMVHVYPTGDQTSTGVGRLENRLRNLWTNGSWWSKTRPTRRGISTAQIAFFSGHPQARAEGATANLLLIINEAQDQDGPTIDRRFTPMRASTNATALYVGTVRTTSDYLWRKKLELEKLQAKDGIARVFTILPQHVGQENTNYLKFVQNQVETKGRQHPAVKTEFFNEPVDTAAGLFPKRRLTLMRGTHPRIYQPDPSRSYIAIIDVAGQDEAATAAFAELDNPGRDSTVCTIVEASKHPVQTQDIASHASHPIGPTYHAQDVFTDQGSRHFQSVPGQPSLFQRLVTYIEHWQPIAIIVDASGVGQGIYDALVERFPGKLIFGFDFAKSYGKARLGNDFLSIIETGRFKYFTEANLPPEGGIRGGSDEPELSAAWWFFTQAEYCGYELTEGQPIERGLKWSVPTSAKILVNGQALLIHDDYLLSAALIAEADRLIKEGHLFIGTTKSAVIQRNLIDN